MVAPFFQNRSGERLSPDPCRGRGHPKNSIITPFGLFEYLVIPLGLSNAAQTFQCMMDRTDDNLEAVFTYMDNFQVGSR
jgi:hypothetical protein